MVDARQSQHWFVITFLNIQTLLYAIDIEIRIEIDWNWNDSDLVNNTRVCGETVVVGGGRAARLGLDNIDHILLYDGKYLIILAFWNFWFLGTQKTKYFTHGVHATLFFFNAKTFLVCLRRLFFFSTEYWVPALQRPHWMKIDFFFVTETLHKAVFIANSGWFNVTIIQMCSWPHTITNAVRHRAIRYAHAPRLVKSVSST